MGHLIGRAHRHEPESAHSGGLRSLDVRSQPKRSHQHRDTQIWHLEISRTIVALVSDHRTKNITLPARAFLLEYAIYYLCCFIRRTIP